MHGKNCEGFLTWWWKEKVCIGFPYSPFCRLLEFVAVFCAPGLHWELGWVAVVLLLLVPSVLPSLVLGSCAPAAENDHLQFLKCESENVMLHPVQQPHSCGAWPGLCGGPVLL